MALTIQAQDDLPAIDVDGDRIVQALVNLISNAVKFSPANAAVLVDVAREGNELRYSITDAGSGIPEEAIRRLFQKVTQLDTSDARRMSGTGLGLAISKASSSNTAAASPCGARREQDRRSRFTCP